MKDPAVKPKNLEQFVSGFTKSKAVKLKTSGHFPQEKHPNEVTKSLIDFLTKNKNQS